MSRFLFATVGSLGDLHPYIAIGRAVIARGHQAVIVSAEEYRGTVQDAGVEFAAARPSLAELGDYQKLVSRIFDARRGPECLVREVVMPGLRAAYDDLSRASRGADLLISHPLTLALPLVAHRCLLPWVGAVLSPLSLMSRFDPPTFAAAPWLRKLRSLGPGVYGGVLGLVKRVAWSWEKPWREFRKELGLPASKHMALFEGQFSPLRNLALFDPQLARPQPDWPDNMCLCGSAVFEGTLQEESLHQADRFIGEGEAPIVFALGSSAVWVAGDFWQHAIGAAQQLGAALHLGHGPRRPAGFAQQRESLFLSALFQSFPASGSGGAPGRRGHARASPAGRPPSTDGAPGF